MMMLEKGWEIYRAGQFEKCEKLLRKHVDQAAEQPGITELYAYTLQKLGNFEKAMDYWNTLLSADGMNPEYYCERGVCKFNLGFKSAMEDMDKALELDPTNPYRYSSRAYILDKLGRTEEAYHGYLRAIELDPEDDITINNLGILEYKLGYSEESRQRFREQEKRLGISDLQSVEKNGPEETRTSEEDVKISRSGKWKEVQKMLSSPKEFKSFVKDALLLFKGK